MTDDPRIAAIRERAQAVADWDTAAANTDILTVLRCADQRHILATASQKDVPALLTRLDEAHRQLRMYNDPMGAGYIADLEHDCEAGAARITALEAQNRALRAKTADALAIMDAQGVTARPAEFAVDLSIEMYRAGFRDSAHILREAIDALLAEPAP